MAIAAPLPVFGLFYQTSLEWVAMDVAELFTELGLGEDVEVVVVELPETRMISFELLRCLCFECAKDAA